MDTEIASGGTVHTRPVALGLDIPVPRLIRAKTLVIGGGSPVSGGKALVPLLLYVPSKSGQPSAVEPCSIGVHDMG